MDRLARLESDVHDLKGATVQIVGLLVDHSERLDRVGNRLDILTERVDALTEHVDALGDRLTDRLDRLIAVTIQERTYSGERLADIERRLTRLEERSGD